MGEFLALSGVLRAKHGQTAEALRAFASSERGTLIPKPGKLGDEGILSLSENASGSVVMYPNEFFEWDKASAFLSKFLDVPVFSFHIHDGDLWMFILYAGGQQVTQFNPIPDYWDEHISNEERDSWKGNPETITHYLPNVPVSKIEKYFHFWDLDAYEEMVKAYPDDQFLSGDCWQMCDFMRRLGFEYPVGNTGNLKGETFSLTIK